MAFAIREGEELGTSTQIPRPDVSLQNTAIYVMISVSHLAISGLNVVELKSTGIIVGKTPETCVDNNIHTIHFYSLNTLDFYV